MDRRIRYKFPIYSSSTKMWVIDIYDRDIIIKFKQFKTFDLAYEFYKNTTKVR